MITLFDMNPFQMMVYWCLCAVVWWTVFEMIGQCVEQKRDFFRKAYQEVMNT